MAKNQYAKRWRFYLEEAGRLHCTAAADVCQRRERLPDMHGIAAADVRQRRERLPDMHGIAAADVRQRRERLSDMHATVLYSRVWKYK